ncbi:hypothetical protein [Rhabdochlamydiaceae symbiont of Dictyostelium giganteum]
MTMIRTVSRSMSPLGIALMNPVTHRFPQNPLFKRFFCDKVVESSSQKT